MISEMTEKTTLDRLRDSSFQPVFATNKACQNCMFAHGEPPFADAPDKSYCQIYERESGESKPRNVAYDGADCEYYEEDI
jgi:hypothetical protein